jgi:hypothetical protein
MAGVASARSWWAFALSVRAARERPSETEEVTMSAQQLTLGLDDARTSTVARLLEGERDE